MGSFWGLSHSPSSLGNGHTDDNLPRLLFLFLWLHQQPRYRSTFTGCDGIIDSGLCVTGIKFACPSFLVTNHRCLFTPMLLCFRRPWTPLLWGSLLLGLSASFASKNALLVCIKHWHFTDDTCQRWRVRGSPRLWWPLLGIPADIVAIFYHMLIKYDTLSFMDKFFK